jgi:hypothetical protein
MPKGDELNLFGAVISIMNMYPINHHVSVKTLTTGRMIPQRTNSPPVVVSSH